MVARPAALPRGDEFVNRSVPDDPARREQLDLVGSQGDVVHEMGRQDDRSGLRLPDQMLSKGDTLPRIQTDRRLVEDEHLGIVHQGRCQEDALALTTREGTEPGSSSAPTAARAFSLRAVISALGTRYMAAQNSTNSPTRQDCVHLHSWGTYPSVAR